MTPDEYQELALRKEADQETIHRRIRDLGPNAVRLDNGHRGLSDEVGEIAAIVKRHIEYGRPLDLGGLLEEVGDCLWRLAQIARAGGFTLSQAMEANLKKLDIRYEGGYTDHRAAEENRDRSAEAAVVAAELTSCTRSEAGPFAPGDRVYFVGPHSEMTWNRDTHLPLLSPGTVVARPPWGSRYGPEATWVQFDCKRDNLGPLTLVVDTKLLGRGLVPPHIPETDQQEGE